MKKSELRQIVREEIAHLTEAQDGEFSLEIHTRGKITKPEFQAVETRLNNLAKKHSFKGIKITPNFGPTKFVLTGFGTDIKEAYRFLLIAVDRALGVYWGAIKGSKMNVPANVMKSIDTYLKATKRSETTQRIAHRNGVYESKENMVEASIAQTILSQLGGMKFVRMTGAKNIIDGGKYLSFNLPKAKNNINFVRITLTSSDLYDIEFGRSQSLNYKTLKKLSGIYADQLQDVFTQYTGLYTKL